MALPLSVVVVAYDIERELPRTLRSLSVGYQRDVGVNDYEVIVVDNGSPTPVDPSVFDDLAGNFRLVRMEDAPPSPMAAANRGLREARGDTIGIMIDGARLASPGLVHYALVGSTVFPRTAVMTVGWYLGYDFQRYAMDAGWTEADEDRLLESIGWPDDGYRLFEIATMDESSVDGWFLGVFESNALFLPAGVWEELGGVDERFDLPGGGFANHDILREAAEVDDLAWVVLLGEGTFHQLHGGIATNRPPEDMRAKFEEWGEQYVAIRGRKYEGFSPRAPVFLGTLPESLKVRFWHAANAMLHYLAGQEPPVPPSLLLTDPPAESDPLGAQWFELARDAVRHNHKVEAQEFARRGRVASPSSSEARRLLPFLQRRHADVISDQPRPVQVRFLVDAGYAYARAGEAEQADAHFREALRLDPGNRGACLGLRELEMPGPGVRDHLRRVHELLDPATYLVVGAGAGEALAVARPPTVAIAVDPVGRLEEPIAVECHFYQEAPSEFFEHRDVLSLFAGNGPTLVVVDELREFSAALRVFVQVESIADAATILVVPHMIPFDEVTQRPHGACGFSTGDVWKLLHCLADVRSDLSWFTLRTPPSGLTFVTGFDRASTVLQDHFDELVARFGALPFKASLDIPGSVLDNDWPLVADQLKRWAVAGSTDGTSGLDRHVGIRVEAPGAPELAIRVRELTSRVASQNQELADAKRLVHSGSLAWAMDPDSAYAELERLRRTKVFRSTSLLRKLYGRLRFRRGAPR